MVDIIIISLTAFLVSILTFFSGFGLGTLLTPVFMIFFPVDLAIALTGLVHFFNNVFKLFLVGRNADRNVLFHFAIPAVLAAIPGAGLMLILAEGQALFSYSLFGKTYDVFLLKFLLSLLLITFAILDLLPAFQKLQFDKNKLTLGGVLSGFFGGLSGNQGALRSAFLIKAGLSKEAFIATAVVASTMVDITRLGIYATRWQSIEPGSHINLILCATISAITGAWIGNRLLRKVTFRFLQITVAIMLILLSLALGLGWI